MKVDNKFLARRHGQHIEEFQGKLDELLTTYADNKLYLAECIGVLVMTAIEIGAASAIEEWDEE